MSTLTAFIIGLVVGWIIEWIIDWLYWRRQRTALAHDLEQSKAEALRLRSDNNDLDNHYAAQRQELNRLQAEVASLKAEKETLQTQAAKPTMVEPLVAPVETARAETIETQSQAEKPAVVEPLAPPVETVRTETIEPSPQSPAEPQAEPVDTVRTEMIEPTHQVAPEPQAGASAPFERDDLEVIVGIGPVIARKLNQSGIYTFSELGRLTADELRAKVGDIISRLADEDDILRQARQLAAQKNQQG